MNSLLKLIVFVISLGFVTSCSQILQNVDLKLSSKDEADQQAFNVIGKTLDIKIARNQNKVPFKRTVLQNGRGEKARPIPEEVALISNLPQNNNSHQYEVGIGDEVKFTRLIDTRRLGPQNITVWPDTSGDFTYRLGIGDTLGFKLLTEIEGKGLSQNGENADQSFIFNPQNTDNTILSEGRIGSDGSVLLLEVGRLDANGKTLNELRSEVRNILIRNGIGPRFQLEIVKYNSQPAYITINSRSELIYLGDQKTSLLDILTSSGVGLQPGIITRVRLQRDSKEYPMTLRKIFSEDATEILIKANDHIIIEDSSANIRVTNSIVDLNGNIVLEGLEALKQLLVL